MPKPTTVKSQVNYTGDPDYDRGYAIGTNDVKNLYDLLTWTGNCPSSPGGYDPFPTNTDSDGDIRIDKTGEGGTCVFWEYNGQTYLLEETQAMKDLAWQQHAIAFAAEDWPTVQYYRGYIRGIDTGYVTYAN